MKQGKVRAVYGDKLYVRFVRGGYGRSSNGRPAPTLLYAQDDKTSALAKRAECTKHSDGQGRTLETFQGQDRAGQRHIFCLHSDKKARAEKRGPADWLCTGHQNHDSTRSLNSKEKS